jgi:hypothetical protein
MPTTVTTHGNVVAGCSDAIRSKFLKTWGGTRAS